MRITRRQLRKIIRECIALADGDPLSFWKAAWAASQNEPDSHVHWCIRGLWHIENDEEYVFQNFDVDTSGDYVTQLSQERVRSLYQIVEYEEEQVIGGDAHFQGMDEYKIQELCEWLATGWHQLDVGPFELGSDWDAEFNF